VFRVFALNLYIGSNVGVMVNQVFMYSTDGGGNFLKFDIYHLVGSTESNATDNDFRRLHGVPLIVLASLLLFALILGSQLIILDNSIDIDQRLEIPVVERCFGAFDNLTYAMGDLRKSIKDLGLRLPC